MNSAELKARRKALKLTQQGLASELDVAVSSVARWEQSNESVPRTIELAMNWIEYTRKPIDEDIQQRAAEIIVAREQADEDAITRAKLKALATKMNDPARAIAEEIGEQDITTLPPEDRDVVAAILSGEKEITPLDIPGVKFITS